MSPSHALDPGSHAQEGQDGAVPAAASARGAGPARLVTAEGRAPLAAPGAVRVSRSRADYPLLLQERFPVFPHGRDALSQLPGVRSEARKGSPRPCRGKRAAGEGPCSRSGRSELPARGWTGGDRAGVLGDGQMLRARLLGN